ncbi:MAG TPA: lysylphosphatidylglycerol synthase transmembrane domain-containing protein [Chloroflexota bacterium]|nr:lysylphosphatidylglycerol synthase transmembrane domain-containing protein [Chloroflexota bacterium]
MKDLLARLKDPKAIAGLILGAVVLAFLLSFSDIHQVGQAFAHFPPVALPVIFGLILIREAIRTVEWRYLLHPLRVHTNWRHTAEALIAGDAAQILPAGIFLQNLVLRQTEEADVTRTLAATLAMQLMEAGVGLLVLAIIPVPGWWALRPAAIVVLAGALTFLFVITRKRVRRWIDERGEGSRIGDLLSNGIQKVLGSMEGLGHWRVLAAAFALTTVYMAFTIGALFVITRAYEVPHVNWLAAAVIYCFTLVVVVLNPIPSDWGVSEGLGTAMFTAFGVKPAVGLTMMLLLRFSIIFSTAILAGVCAAIFRQDVEQVVDGPDVAA